MTVGGITGQTFYEKLQGQKRKNPQDGAQAGMAFSNNLKDSDVLKGWDMKEEQKETEGITAASSSSYTNSLHTSMLIHESGRIQMGAVIECSAQHISYAESDNVKVCVEEGYTFKAKVYADSHKVYIEKKMDSGEVTGYEVNPLKLDADTQDPVEQMALESWELAKRAFMGDAPFHEVNPQEELKKQMGEQIPESEEEKGYENLTVEEGMQRFYKFVEDRIKNGAPKYQIGASEMSVKEWNRLLEKIDAEIDAAKEQLREEIRKAKEEAKKVTSEKESEVTKAEDGITKEQIARLFEDQDSDGPDFATPVNPEEVYQAWMSQGAETPFTYIINRGLNTEKNSISLVPGVNIRLSNGFLLFVEDSRVGAKGDVKNQEAARTAAAVSGALNSLIKAANGQIPMNFFYQNDQNSSHARMGLEAAGIDTSRSFFINEREFLVDEKGVIRMRQSV